ncbi:gliding motility-associated ABC transporter permease subunit GldF [Robiginitalea marina]|uniref:Gliding motility-associated ABC transporter permease subunit GldF n=1 Tax=Robiginitalea marina TaxID=2954105 RepID=A0ABT1AU11_9FLAO|nr:gliding motility-associated ABC transporter permease subunit GldF [Robiginitalea marina]MCO5723354.1 gliding motility-associated ABC transporter permease subunit GldF [Robiginitalea marina]
MWSVFRKEIASFFTSPVGYLVMGLFLVLTGLFLWVFRGPFNIFDHGFANLGLFFLLAPWIFLLLIPALTMRSFAEERKLGTLELLLSKPLPVALLVLGKYLGALALVLLAVVPTVLYVATLYELGTEPGNFDAGLVTGSYAGLVFLMGVYTAIGQFTSTLTENQIASFMGGVLLCFLLYYGFEALSTLFDEGQTALWVQKLGMKAHYERISQGILDSRDLVYFLSLTLFFLYLSVKQLNGLKR